MSTLKIKRGGKRKKTSTTSTDSSEDVLVNKKPKTVVKPDVSDKDAVAVASPTNKDVDSSNDAPKGKTPKIPQPFKNRLIAVSMSHACTYDPAGISFIDIKEKVCSGGGKCVSIVHKKVDVVIVSDSALRTRSQKFRKAEKLRLPVAKVNFIQACIDQGRFLNPREDEFVAKIPPRKPKVTQVSTNTATDTDNNTSTDNNTNTNTDVNNNTNTTHVDVERGLTDTNTTTTTTTTSTTTSSSFTKQTTSTRTHATSTTEHNSTTCAHVDVTNNEATPRAKYTHAKKKLWHLVMERVYKSRFWEPDSDE